VKNCEGYERILKVLNNYLAGHDIKKCNVDTLINDLYYNLTEKYYNTIFGFIKDVKLITRAILTRRLLNKYKPIFKTDKILDKFIRGWVNLIQANRK